MIHRTDAKTLTNEVPPRVCAPRGLQVYDGAMAEGGAFSFMASELLAPAKFELEDLIPIQVADQMAFGLVVLQVLDPNYPQLSRVCSPL